MLTDAGMMRQPAGGISVMRCMRRAGSQAHATWEVLKPQSRLCSLENHMIWVLSAFALFASTCVVHASFMVHQES